MKRLALALATALVTLALPAAAAQAAVPTVGSLAATDIQGVSALLKGEVNPQGEATTYRFEYSTQADFSGAVQTAVTPVGSNPVSHPARASVAGLAPSTTYHYRLVATNASGTATTAGTFATTQGFGFLPGAAGFGVHAIADGGTTSTLAGSQAIRSLVR